jgi:hypothetical protein
VVQACDPKVIAKEKARAALLKVDAPIAVVNREIAVTAAKSATAKEIADEVVLHSIRKPVATILENAGVSENVADEIPGPREAPQYLWAVFQTGHAAGESRNSVIRVNRHTTHRDEELDEYKFSVSNADRFRRVRKRQSAISPGIVRDRRGVGFCIQGQ